METKVLQRYMYVHIQCTYTLYSVILCYWELGEEKISLVPPPIGINPVLCIILTYVHVHVHTHKHAK